jgi:phosphoribosylanthranilate isomerase
MRRLSFQIKICGVTSGTDAAHAIKQGADAIGLNFYAQSKRFINLDEAAQVCSTISQNAPVVGVFVNSSVMEVSTVRSYGRDGLVFQCFDGATEELDETQPIPLFDWIQLHGDETPEFVRQVKASLGLPIIRALRWGREGAGPIDEYLQQCAALDCLPDAVLIDSHTAGEYGGTGQTADWEAIAKWHASKRFDIPLVLAGGLTPENVAEAIRIVPPDAVDTASGVESAPGCKDAERVRAFIAEAKRAFAALG